MATNETGLINDASVRPTRHERAFAIARSAGAGAVLTAYPPSVTWLTGFGGESDNGPRRFSLPPLALLDGQGTPTLIISADEALSAAGLGCHVTSYSGFEDAVEAVAAAIHGRRVATEPGYLPLALAEVDWVDVSVEFTGARAVKDPDEMEKIRTAVALCDAGQRAARKHAAVGMSELELWGLIRQAIEKEAGRPIRLIGSVLSGPRTAEIGGAPTDRVIELGDLLLVDLVSGFGAYWGDSCATFSVGQPPSEHASRIGMRCGDALGRLLEAVKPGVIAEDVDALARRELIYPHHTGHGVGTLPFEAPRIELGSKAVLEAGMVIALEPGMYESGEGVRLEKLVVVTPDGAEVLSKHEVRLEQ